MVSTKGRFTGFCSSTGGYGLGPSAFFRAMLDSAGDSCACFPSGIFSAVGAFTLAVSYPLPWVLPGEQLVLSPLLAHASSIIKVALMNRSRRLIIVSPYLVTMTFATFLGHLTKSCGEHLCPAFTAVFTVFSVGLVHRFSGVYHPYRQCSLIGIGSSPSGIGYLQSYLNSTYSVDWPDSEFIIRTFMAPYFLLGVF